MIYGVVNKDKDIRYSQTNNATEKLIKSVLAEEKSSWLETCGPSSFCCVLEGLGVIDGKVRYQGLECQPEDFFTNYAQDNYKGNFPHRILSTWEDIAYIINLKTDYLVNPSFAHLASELMNGRGVMAHIKGHYIALIAYDTATKEIIWMNSWSGDKRNKNGGNNERMTEAEMKKFELDRALVIWR